MQAMISITTTPPIALPFSHFVPLSLGLNLSNFPFNVFFLGGGGGDNERDVPIIQIPHWPFCLFLGDIIQKERARIFNSLFESSFWKKQCSNDAQVGPFLAQSPLPVFAFFYANCKAHLPHNTISVYIHIYIWVCIHIYIYAYLKVYNGESFIARSSNFKLVRNNN